MSVPFWSQAGVIARTDLRAEFRTGEVLAVTIPFGAVALMLIPFGIGTDVPLLRQIGVGIYWAVVLLFGMLVALRRSAAEGPAQRDLLGLLGVDPAARFTGRALSTGVLVVAFELVLGPIAIALYDIQITGWAWLILVVLMVAAGLALLSTLIGSIVGSTGAAPALVPFLVAPLAIPMLLAATQAFEGLRLDESILGWLLLLAAMDLLLAIAGVLSARPLQEVR